MAIRFSLFGRRTSAPSARQQQVSGPAQRSSESGLLAASEKVKHIRDRARERLARADQAFGQTESAG